MGFEPTTASLATKYSTPELHPHSSLVLDSGVEPRLPLSQRGVQPLHLIQHCYGAPREIRTPDPWFRRPVLYPAELWRQLVLLGGIEPPFRPYQERVLPLYYSSVISDNK